MESNFLVYELTNLGPATKENRQRVANIVLNQIELFEPLLHITFQVDDKLSIKASWILEWICTHYGIDYILPYLDEFTSNIHRLRLDSAIRPCAKICEQLAVAYDQKKNKALLEVFEEKHRSAIIETAFDWLITPQKIAVRAYTMNTLFLLGKSEDWVHPELEHIIKTNIIHESKGCEARGKYILQVIEKHRFRAS